MQKCCFIFRSLFIVFLWFFSICNFSKSFCFSDLHRSRPHFQSSPACLWRCAHNFEPVVDITSLLATMVEHFICCCHLCFNVLFPACPQYLIFRSLISSWNDLINKWTLIEHLLWPRYYATCFIFVNSIIIINLLMAKHKWSEK